MNQILVTEKVIVTKEMRQKKKSYKAKFILSIFAVCILFSYYVYAEYDRNKNEEVSKDILNSITKSVNSENDDTTMDQNTFVASNSIKIENDVLKVFLGGNSETTEEVKLGNILKETKNTMQNNSEEETNEDEGMEETVTEEYTTNDGNTTYSSEAILKIPNLGIEYPVLSETSEELLKISINKLWGPGPNEVGNYCVAGHNYKSGKMFGKLKNINIGEKMELTDLKGRTVTYIVSDKYTIDPTDVNCTSQLTNGRRKLTLITCSNSGSKRLVIQGYEQE